MRFGFVVVESQEFGIESSKFYSGVARRELPVDVVCLLISIRLPGIDLACQKLGVGLLGLATRGLRYRSEQLHFADGSMYTLTLPTISGTIPGWIEQI